MLSLDEIKQIQLEELKYIDQLCRENGIEYSLTYGSLIGAVRHHGFIPWDDDIDIMMRRNDYEKLLSILSDSDNTYRLLTYRNNWFNWAKICDTRTYIEEDDDYNIQDYGVWLDIFPLDEVPDPAGFRGKAHMFLVKMTNNVSQMRAISRSHAKTVSGLKRILWLLRHDFLSLLPVSFFSKAAYKVLTKYRGKKTGFMGEGNYYWRSPKRSFPSDIFDSYVDVRFEQLNVRVISDYDMFLRNTYGNYMKLPPADQQRSVHQYRAFWKSI